MMSIEALKEAGINVDDGLLRCLGKEDFYLKMVNLGLSNQNFQLLLPALQEKNYKNAFELCHSLKGVIGNLSLSPLYELICNLTESLRKLSLSPEKQDNPSTNQDELLNLYNQIISMQKKLLSL